MKSKEIFAVDCDGVLLDWHSGFVKWIEDVYGWTVKPNYVLTTYDMEDMFENGTGNIMTHEIFVKLVGEYNSKPRCLKPLDYAIRTLITIKKYFDFKVVLVSSFGQSPDAVEFRKDYLDILFENAIDEYHILPLGQCKKDILADIKPNYFVEDNKQHAESAISLGITTFLIKTTYNQGGRAIYVDDWLDILSDLTFTKSGGR